MAEDSTHLPWGPVALGWETGSGVALGKTRLIGQRVSPKTDRSCYTHTCRGRDYSLIRTIAGSWWGIFEESILSTLLCQKARLPIAWWRIGIHTVGMVDMYITKGTVKIINLKSKQIKLCNLKNQRAIMWELNHSLWIRTLNSLLYIHSPKHTLTFRW